MDSARMTSKELASTFDSVGSNYDKFRPGYLDALYREIFSCCPLDSSSQVLEIGIGSGQATRPFLEIGCHVKAVEPGAKLAALCKEKFSEYPNLTVINQKFEDVSLEAGSFDLIYSATAFHWIPEALGYPKVFSLLKNDGVFAQFANHPDPYVENPKLSEELRQLYKKYFFSFWKEKKRKFFAFTEDGAKLRAEIIEKYGFSNCRYFLFKRLRTFSAKEYIGLLNTYSDHIAIPEPLRNEFFLKIAGVIDRNGGRFVVRDTLDLELAKKQ